MHYTQWLDQLERDMKLATGVGPEDVKIDYRQLFDSGLGLPEALFKVRVAYAKQTVAAADSLKKLAGME